MMAQNAQTITFGQFQQSMGQIKRRMAQTMGEANQIISDVQSQSMEQILQMAQNAFNQVAVKDQEIGKLKENIEKCYNAHPELKAIVESLPEEKKGKARKV